MTRSPPAPSHRPKRCRINSGRVSSSPPTLSHDAAVGDDERRLVTALSAAIWAKPDDPETERRALDAWRRSLARSSRRWVGPPSARLAGTSRSSSACRAHTKTTPLARSARHSRSSAGHPVRAGSVSRPARSCRRRAPSPHCVGSAALSSPRRPPFARQPDRGPCWSPSGRSAPLARPSDFSRSQDDPDRRELRRGPETSRRGPVQVPSATCRVTPHRP